MVNFGQLAAEIVSLVWGTPANFNGFRFLAALLHSQTAALNRGRYLYSVGGHHVGHWPTFLVASFFGGGLPFVCFLLVALTISLLCCFALVVLDLVSSVLPVRQEIG